MPEQLRNKPPKPEQPKTPTEIIQEMKDAFETFLKESPAVAAELKNEVLELAGVREGELVNLSMDFDFGLVKIPLAKLGLFGTNCGKVDNKAFTPKVLEFLAGLKVEFIIALSHNREFRISSAAIPISEEDGDKLGELIEKGKGSFRAEPSDVKGWTGFESE